MLQRPSSSPKSTAGSCAGSSRTKRTRTSTRARRRWRSSRDFEGERLDYWVTGFGTGGTLKGVARVLRERAPDTRIVVCEPDNSPMLASGIAQPRDADGAPAASHPAFRPHLMQGWSPDFIPKLDRGRSRSTSWSTSRRPSTAPRRCGCRGSWRGRRGSSAGSPAARRSRARSRCASAAPEGATILCMLPDTGERYLSTPLFEGIAAEMIDEELEISRLHAALSLRRAGGAARARREHRGAASGAETRRRRLRRVGRSARASSRS